MSVQPTGKIKAAAAAAAILAAPVTSQWEGLRTKAYLDAVGIPTICYGETEGVRIGDVKTKPECDALFTMRLGFFSLRTALMFKVEVNPHVHAAATSLAYNIGLSAFEKSTVLRRINEGRFRDACEFFPRYKYAGGRVLNGLVKRRVDEMKLCLKGVV